MANPVFPVSDIYDSSRRGNSSLEELRGIFLYRDLIFQLVRRDIVARYKRSVLGIAWTMLQPLGMMVVMTVVFSQLFHQVEGYPAYFLSGFIAFTFFAQTTTAAIHQIVWGAALLNRIYMPRTAFAISAVGTGLVNLLISLVPLIAIILFLKIPITINILFLPVSMLLLTCFSLGIGLILSTMAVSFPDVTEMYQIILVAWQYLTPVFYPEETIPEAYRFWVFTFNPMYYFLKLFRMPLYDGTPLDWQTLLVGAGIALVTLFIGWVAFSRNADQFAYHA